VEAEDVMKRVHDDRGAVGLTVVLLVVFVLLAMAALVTDVGMLYVERHSLQAAADAGALAGARAYFLGQDWQSIATSYAERNLPAGASVDPPTLSNGYVKVKVSDSSFRAPLASSTSQVSAVAAAVAQSPTGSKVMPLCIVIGAETPRTPGGVNWKGANGPYDGSASKPEVPSAYGLPYAPLGFSLNSSVPAPYYAADDKVNEGNDKTYGVQPMLRGFYRWVDKDGNVAPSPYDGQAAALAGLGINQNIGDQWVMHTGDVSKVIVVWFGAVGNFTSGSMRSVPNNFDQCVAVDSSTGFATILQPSARLVVLPVGKWPSWMMDGNWSDRPLGLVGHDGWAADTVRIVGYAWFWLDDKVEASGKIVGIKMRYVRPLGFDESTVPDLAWGSPDPYGAVAIHLVDPDLVP
jgi:Flp pilus assembly protein TadG